MTDTETSRKVYNSARSAWNASAQLRERRLRFKNYTYGRQWDDITVTPSGERMTEYDYACRSGKKPLTNNLIRQLVKSVVGRFRHLLAEEKCPANLREVAERNMLDELDCRLLEEFLISGCAVQRIVDERRIGSGSGVWVDNVNPARFFVNPYSDPRGTDIELVGMLHDMSLREVLLRFGDNNPSTIAHLTELYSRKAAFDNSDILPDATPYRFATAEAGRCRVIEAWALETRSMLKCHDTRRGTLFYLDPSDASQLEALNASRSAKGLKPVEHRNHLSARWRGYFFAPGGELLRVVDSPYPHGSHPFAVKLYPLTDGEVHPFVEDIIDTQRHVNRLITLIDHILSFSAKGVLLFPENAKPEEMSWEMISQRWCQPNGILPYNDSNGSVPTQAYSSNGASGVYELLNTELRLFEQISGVNGALRGISPSANVGAGLYNAQTENALISLLDIFETFNSFRHTRNRQIASSFTSFSKPGH